jgi:hypothetical protein
VVDNVENPSQPGPYTDNLTPSGEHAADALTGFLKPATLTLHVPAGTQKRTATRLRLAPSQGRIEVILIDRFQMRVDADIHEPAPRIEPHTHPILVRAELLASGSDRLREVADRLLGPILNRLTADAAGPARPRHRGAPADRGRRVRRQLPSCSQGTPRRIKTE